MVKKIPVELIKNSNYWKPNSEKEFNMNTNSWFNITCKKQDNVKQSNYTINGENLRCKKVLIKPTQIQRKILKEWIEIYRRVYNLTVWFYRKHELNSKIDMRYFIDKEIAKNKELSELIKKSGIYKHTVDNAIFDVYKAYKTAIANLKCGNIKFFRIRYKKFKKPKQTLVLEPTSFNKNGLGLKKKILSNLNPSSKIETKREVRLCYNKKFKQFILYIPYNKVINKEINTYSKCALDPGIRTFQTVYSNDGICYQICGNTNLIKNDLNKIELVKKFKKEKWYKKYTSRLYKRLQNRIDDMQWKTCNFLCNQFSNIVIGNMSIKSIVRKNKSVLTKTTKRLCCMLSHFTFRQRLQTKCDEYETKFKVVDESYTSKTCGSCGLINNKLGGSETFTCNKSNCNYTMHRDIHGARNILIKNND